MDSNAIRLEIADHVPVGYLPRYLASEAISLFNSNRELRVLVERVNPPPAPTQQWLLCRLKACWPSNFQPFASDTYQPIPAEATNLRQWPQG